MIFILLLIKMLFIRLSYFIVLLINYTVFVICNPTTSLNELAIVYMAQKILSDEGIDSIDLTINGKKETIKFNSYDNPLDFIKGVWAQPFEIYSGLVFYDKVFSDWQEKFDKYDQQTTKTVNNYINGRDRITMNIGSEEYILAKSTTPRLKWKNGMHNSDFNAHYEFLMDSKYIKSHSNRLKFFSTIVNELAPKNTNYKSQLNDLLDKIADKRIRKLTSSGHYMKSLIEDKIEELIEKFELQRRNVNIGKDKDFILSIKDGVDLSDEDKVKETFVNKKDLNKPEIAQTVQNKLKNMKGLVSLPVDDSFLGSLKEMYKDGNNINMKGSLSEIDHAKLINFGETKKMGKIKKTIITNEEDGKITKITKITCKI